LINTPHQSIGRRPSKGECQSDDKTLKFNADGSLTIYLQKDSPGPTKEANWLPAPAGEYSLILLAYAPGEALLRSLTEPDRVPLPPIDLVE
jgi:hypothetical protein